MLSRDIYTGLCARFCPDLSITPVLEAAFESLQSGKAATNIGFVQSAVVKVDLASGQVAQRYDNVGMNCHGLVMWRGVFVLLSSKETSLITLNPSTKEVTYIWSVC